MDYCSKYKKYKNKYLQLKGGDRVELFLNSNKINDTYIKPLMPVLDSYSFTIDSEKIPTAFYIYISLKIISLKTNTNIADIQYSDLNIEKETNIEIEINTKTHKIIGFDGLYKILNGIIYENTTIMEYLMSICCLYNSIDNISIESFTHMIDDFEIIKDYLQYIIFMTDPKNNDIYFTRLDDISSYIMSINKYLLKIGFDLNKNNNIKQILALQQIINNINDNKTELKNNIQEHKTNTLQYITLITNIINFNSIALYRNTKSLPYTRNIIYNNLYVNIKQLYEISKLLKIAGYMVNTIIEYKTHNSTLKHTIFNTPKFDNIILKETTDYINKLYLSKHKHNICHYCCIVDVLQTLLACIIDKSNKDIINTFVFEIDDIKYLSEVNNYIDENIIFKYSNDFKNKLYTLLKEHISSNYSYCITTQKSVYVETICTFKNMHNVILRNTENIDDISYKYTQMFSTITSNITSNITSGQYTILKSI